MKRVLLYILKKVWVLRTPNAGLSQFFNVFLKFLQDYELNIDENNVETELPQYLIQVREIVQILPIVEHKRVHQLRTIILNFCIKILQKHRKRRFLKAFVVHSTQMLVKIYIRGL